MRRLLIAASIGLCALPAAANAATVKVTSADSGNGWYSADTRSPGTGTFELGPATPPLGNGSFELNTPTAGAKVQLFTDAYNGVALADIDGIGYSSYRDPVSAPDPGVAMVALNLRIDTNNDSQPDAYMVYEPYQDGGTVLEGVWQNWDAYRGGAAKWWINTGAAGCGQATPCTWNTIVTNIPGVTIREGLNCGPLATLKAPCPGSLGFNQGSGNPTTLSNGDALYVSVSGNSTTYNFDAPVGPPASKDACKTGGWATFDTPRSFKNQGDCIQYVNTGK